MIKQYPYLINRYYENENGKLSKRKFLSSIDDFINQKQYVKITLLNWNEEPLRDIEGEITGGTLTKDGASPVRTTCSLQCNVDAESYNTESMLADYAINKKIFLEIGIRNDTDQYPEYPILWFPQGVFIINSLSINSSSSSAVSLSFNLKDKMALLDGTVGGIIPSTTWLDTMVDEIEGNVIKNKKVLIYDIIMELVNHFGGESLERIVIEDIDPILKRIIKWNGKNPVYIKESTDEQGQKKYEISKTDNGGSKYSAGIDMGYTLSNFVYDIELVANAGDSVCTILDKIKNYLGNYEYFYDEYGIFHFREIKNYLNTTHANYIMNEEKNRVINEEEEHDYLACYDCGKTVFNFTDNTNLVSITKTPQYENIKNDFIVYGKSKNNDKIELMYHLVIDDRPQINEDGYDNILVYADPSISNGQNEIYTLAMPKPYPADDSSGDMNVIYMKIENDSTKKTFKRPEIACDIQDDYSITYLSLGDPDFMDYFEEQYPVFWLPEEDGVFYPFKNSNTKDETDNTIKKLEENIKSFEEGYSNVDKKGYYDYYCKIREKIGQFEDGVQSNYNSNLKYIQDFYKDIDNSFIQIKKHYDNYNWKDLLLNKIYKETDSPTKEHFLTYRSILSNLLFVYENSEIDNESEDKVDYIERVRSSLGGNGDWAIDAWEKDDTNKQDRYKNLRGKIKEIANKNIVIDNIETIKNEIEKCYNIIFNNKKITGDNEEDYDILDRENDIKIAMQNLFNYYSLIFYCDAFFIELNSAYAKYYEKEKKLETWETFFENYKYTCKRFKVIRSCFISILETLEEIHVIYKDFYNNFNLNDENLYNFVIEDISTRLQSINQSKKIFVFSEKNGETGEDVEHSINILEKNDFEKVWTLIEQARIKMTECKKEAELIQKDIASTEKALLKGQNLQDYLDEEKELSSPISYVESTLNLKKTRTFWYWDNAWKEIKWKAYYNSNEGVFKEEDWVDKIETIWKENFNDTNKLFEALTKTGFVYNGINNEFPYLCQEEWTLDEGALKKAGEKYIAKDYRTEIILQGLQAQDLATDENSPYYDELYANWGTIYDLANQEFFGVEDKYEENEFFYSTTLGMYYFDILDANKNPEVAQYSIKNIGRRTLIDRRDDVNCLFLSNIPDIIFWNVDGEDWEYNASYLFNEDIYYQVKIKQDLWDDMATGGSSTDAFTAIKYDLLTHTIYQNTLSLTAIPCYYLEPNSRVSIKDFSTNTYGDYLITNISIPLGAGNQMSVSCSQVFEKM